MEGVRAAFTHRLENAETLVLTDSLERRRKYSSNNCTILYEDALSSISYNSHLSSHSFTHIYRTCPSSVISSRDQTPEDLKTALTRYHESKYPVVVLDKGSSEVISDIEMEGKADLVPDLLKYSRRWTMRSRKQS